MIMKQLVNKLDRNIRLVGLEAVKDADGYIYFNLPKGGCIWSGREWEIEDYEPHPEPKGESEAFRSWLEKEVDKRKFKVSGIGPAMGLSTNWLWNILRGKRQLPMKRAAELEEVLGMKPGAIVRALGRSKSGKTPTIK